MARVADLVCEKLIELERESGNIDAVNAWMKWRKADLNRRETQLLVTRIREMEEWDTLPNEQKQQFILDFMAPLLLSEEHCSELLRIKR